MGKFITSFENHNAYQQVIFDENNTPNISLCRSEDEIHYQKLIINEHEYVEIGGIKWATMNLGANSVTDYGLKFQWGDTQGYTNDQVGNGEGQKYFAWEDYKYTNDGGATMTKYNSTDGLVTLQAGDDAVTAAWGGNWRMPTISEWQALGDAVDNGDVTSAWTSDYQGSGISGITFTDASDSSKVLFFPATGLCNYGSMQNVGDYGFYWSSSLDADYDERITYYMYFYSDGASWDASESRFNGYSVRGILDE